LQVLRMLHSRHVCDSMPIDILMDEAKNIRYVAATETVFFEGIMLPPCVPKSKQLSLESVHPHRVAVSVSVLAAPPSDAKQETKPAVAEAGGESENSRKRRNTGKTSPAVAGANVSAVVDARKRSCRFYVVPEWKGPKCNFEQGDIDAGEWVWVADESMHPFWAIRRLPETKAQDHDHQFNMMCEEVTFASVIAGVVDGKTTSTTAEATVPFLTNNVEISKNAEMLLQVEEPMKAANKHKNWKDQVAQEEKEEKKAKAKGATAKAKSSASRAIDI
jgi:hypothetical protein